MSERRAARRQGAGGRRTGGLGSIPSPAARVGKVLRLRGPAGWEDGWIVEAVYQTQPAEVVAILERLHTRSRRYTDI